MHNCYKKAFGLIELLTTLAIIAIFVTLVMPRFVEIQVQARREVVKSQADSIRRAIQMWMSNKDTTYEAANSFGGTTDGDITFIDETTWNSEIRPFLEDSFVDAAQLTFNTSSNGYITSLQSSELEVESSMVIPGSISSAWGGVPRASSTIAHVRIAWSSDMQERYSSSPAVFVFLPEEITIE